jgi:hypothetical protein
MPQYFSSVGFYLALASKPGRSKSGWVSGV